MLNRYPPHFNSILITFVTILLLTHFFKNEANTHRKNPYIKDSCVVSVRSFLTASKSNMLSLQERYKIFTSLCKIGKNFIF